MDVVFEETSAFLRDIKKLDPHRKRLLEERINKLADHYAGGQRPRNVRLALSLHSSLYAARLDRHAVLIHSREVDPVFDELILRLYRLVPHDAYSRVLSELGERLYREQGLEEPQQVSAAEPGNFDVADQSHWWSDGE